MKKKIKLANQAMKTKKKEDYQSRQMKIMKLVKKEKKKRIKHANQAMMKKLVIPDDDSTSSDTADLSRQLDMRCSINPETYHDFKQIHQSTGFVVPTPTKATTTFSLGAAALEKYKAMKTQPSGGFMRRAPEWTYGYCGTEWWVGKRGRWWRRDEHGTFVLAKCGGCGKPPEYLGCTYKR